MKKIIFSILTLLSIGLAISSCDFPDVDYGVSQDFMTHVARVNFITDTSDDASGLLMTDLDNATITISGPDADKVFNIEGKKSFAITGGMLQLLLDPTADFISKSEYRVNLIVEATGYLKRIVPITFIQEENDSAYEIAMLKKNNLPSGISLTTSNSGIINATTGLASTINLTASNSATNGVTTEISIPSGIIMKDVNNNTISGNLGVELISFSDTENTTAYFPGGLSPDNIDMGNGVTDSGSFVSAGFATINMSVGGKKVKTFEGGKVGVKMTLSTNNYNPTTNNPYVKDDTVDIWSYDEDLGQWKFESTGIVKKDTDNSLYVAFETSHLTSFNLDYIFRGNAGKCNRTPTIQFNWSANVASIDCRFVFTSLAAGAPSWSQLSSSFQRTLNKGQNVYLYYAPRAAMRLNIYYTSSGKLLYSKNFAPGELCTNPVVNLNVSLIDNPVVTLAYQGMCANTTTKVLPPVGSSIYFRETGTSQWRMFHYVSYLNRAQTKITTTLLTVGKTYDFYVFVGSKKAIVTYTISRPNYFIDVALPTSICNSVK